MTFYSEWLSPRTGFLGVVLAFVGPTAVAAVIAALIIYFL